MNTRRQFLIKAPIGLLGVAAACRGEQPQPATPAASGAAPAGAPPTFGTTPEFGPPVTTATFVEAEKLMEVQMTDAERDMAAKTWRTTMAATLERRVGPRKVELDATVSPALLWNPSVPAARVRAAGDTMEINVVMRDVFVRDRSDPGPLPANEADIAFAPVTKLSRWIEQRKLTSTRLTNIYLTRIAQFDPKLRCVITVTKDFALAQAKKADDEIAAGRYRGALHGIPYGVKDLLDTANIPTTYGAEPFRDRVPTANSAVVERLNNAGAVLIAKLSMGALALNDIWFGGQTMNPWVLEEGASGSSAGPGAATAAALVAFAIGSETEGSIVSPTMRCGITGLRPTFGRVPRSGAMTLCWSLDKLGPMTRSVEDAMLVLKEITGPDAKDYSSVSSKLAFNSNATAEGLRVGYFRSGSRKVRQHPSIKPPSMHSQNLA